MIIKSENSFILLHRTKLHDFSQEILSEIPGAIEFYIIFKRLQSESLFYQFFFCIGNIVVLRLCENDFQS